MALEKFKYRSLQHYLDELGVLENGSDEQIRHARRCFRALYLKHYRKHYKKHHPSVSVSFRHRDKLLLASSAKEKGMKLASFIQRLALDYVHRPGKPVKANPNLTQVKRLFLLCYDLVEELLFENESPELTISYERLLKLFREIEKTLRPSL